MYDEAIQKYTEAIQIDNNVPQFYTNRAKCYIIKGEYQKAIEDGQYALDINEKDIAAHFVIGKSLCKRGQVTKNVKDIDKSIKRY